MDDGQDTLITAAPSVPRLFNEETTVEREIIEHLKTAALGWEYHCRDEVTALRVDEREVLLLSRLREKLIELNPDVLTDSLRVDAIITKLRACRDNQQWIKWLKDGVNYQFDATEKSSRRSPDRLREPRRQRVVGDEPVSRRRPKSSAT